MGAPPAPLAGFSFAASPLFWEPLMNIPGVLYYYVEGGDGIIWMHSDPSLRQRTAAEWRAQLPADATIEYASPVEVEGRVIAYARLGVPRRFLRITLPAIGGGLLPSLVVSVVCGVIVSLLLGAGLAFWLARPIQKLANASEELGQGNLSVEVPILASNELGELSRQFNQMARRLRSLDELKDEFICAVSHDLRSPMAAIRMYADFMLNVDVDKDKILPKHRNMLAMVMDNATRLNVFVSNILDAAKMKAGQMEYHLQPVAVEGLVRNVEGLYSILASQKGVRLDVQLPPALPPVQADPERLQQVLANLVSNALKFTRGGGRVTIEARESGPRLEISVVDTGMGISKEELPRLFQRFRQADVAGQHAKGIQGTGLGLFIVKQTMEAMDGEVNVESEPGKGTRFTLRMEKGAPAAAGGT